MGVGESLCVYILRAYACVKMSGCAVHAGASACVSVSLSVCEGVCVIYACKLEYVSRSA